MSNSFWQKESSLRKAKPAAVEPELRAAAPEPLPAPEPVAEAPVPQPEGEASPPLPRGDYGWLTSNFDPAEVPDAMPTIAAPPVSLQTQPVEDPAPLQAVPHVRPPEVEVPAVVPPPVVVPAATVAPAADVPVWKKEFFEDGEVWVEGEWDQNAPRAAVS